MQIKFNSLLYKTNRFHVAVGLFSNRSVTHSAIASCATFLFLPHFDVICDLLLNRRTATWNLFVNCVPTLVWHISQTRRFWHGNKVSTTMLTLRVGKRVSTHHQHLIHRSFTRGLVFSPRLQLLIWIRSWIRHRETDWSARAYLTIGTLSTRVFETRTATGSDLISLSTCLHSTTFIVVVSYLH